MSISRQTDKKVVVHIQNRILLSYKKKNRLESVLIKWMKLESIKQSIALLACEMICVFDNEL